MLCFIIILRDSTESQTDSQLSVTIRRNRCIFKVLYHITQMEFWRYDLELFFVIISLYSVMSSKKNTIPIHILTASTFLRSLVSNQKEYQERKAIFPMTLTLT
jgi:hypothetical protein